MDEIAIYDSLQDCLLSDEEMARGIEAWREFPDPFPKWNLSVADVIAQAGPTPGPAPSPT